MSAHFPRFLNLPTRSDPFALLGLTPEQCTPVKIDEQLRKRLGQMFNHPDGRSDEAEEVREALRKAAAQLLDPYQRERLIRAYRRPHIRPMLTHFDREVLAILVGSGGWNAVSRARLVSLAQERGVAPRGLMKVISGLSHYARTGAHLETADITAGSPRYPIGNGATRSANGAARGTLDRLGAISDSFVEKYAPMLREESTSATVKLSLLFGVLAAILSIVFVVMLIPEAPPSARESDSTETRVMPSVAASRHDDEAAESEQTAVPPRNVTLEVYPTFSESLPVEVVEAATACAAVPDEVKRIARQISITDSPSEAVFRTWDAALDDASLGWLIVDDELRRQIDLAMLEVFIAVADKPAVSDRLIRALRPASVEQWAEQGFHSLDVVRQPWRIMQLSRISQRSDLPPIVGDQSRTVYGMAGDSPALPAIDGNLPEACAAAWLDHALPQMIRLVARGEGLMEWELWIAAQQTLRDEELFELAVVAAVHHLLRASAPLRAEEPALNVLGRLIDELNFSRRAIARERLPLMLDDERINSDRLAFFTAVLAAHPELAWIDESNILPIGADEVLRRRVRDNLVRSWPEDSRTTTKQQRPMPAIAPELVLHWTDLHDQLSRQPVSTGRVEPMRQLVATAQLNRIAAMMAAGDGDAARRTLDRLQRTLNEDRATQQSGPTNTNPRARGGVPGVRAETAGDGLWAVGYEQARRNPTDRLKELRALHRMEGDLGPRDAETFVREVYRATPMDMREEAQSILTTRFPRGVNVSMMMLDLFYEAPRISITSDLISQYTGRPLPDVRSELWRWEARHALVQHAATLRGADDPQVDELSRELLDIALSEAAVVDPSRRAAVNAQQPVEAAEARYRAWKRLALALRPGSVAIPGDLTAITRRHEARMRFAQSPIQCYVALQISILELAAYAAAAEQPNLSGALIASLQHSLDRRLESERLLEQAVRAERGITEVWRLRLTSRGAGPNGSDERSANDQHPSRVASTDVPRVPISALLTGLVPIRSGMPQPRAGSYRGVRGERGEEYKLLRNSEHESSISMSRSRPVLLTTILFPSASSAISAVNFADRWASELEALDPKRPQRYFELAEEIADAATTGEETDLARHLFALAGVLSPERLGASAFLALANIEPNRMQRERYRALAALLDPHAPITPAERDPAQIGNESREMPAVLELGEAFSAIRLGRGNRAAVILRRHAVRDVIDDIADAPGFDRQRLVEESQSRRRPIDPASGQIDRQLMIELALLAGAQRPWSADLAINENRPLVEVDFNMLSRMLGENAGRPYYRDGRWASRPSGDRSQ